MRIETGVELPTNALWDVWDKSLIESLEGLPVKLGNNGFEIGKVIRAERVDPDASNAYPFPYVKVTIDIQPNSRLIPLTEQLDSYSIGKGRL